MNDLPESTPLANTLQALSQALSALGPDAPLQFGIHDPRLDELIFSLPRLTEVDLGPQRDGVCPICLVQFRAHLAEEETALAMDSPAHAEQDLGVTRLENTCRHVFCRRDITMWIRQSRNSCPTCRRPLLESPEESGSPPEETNGAYRENSHSVPRNDDQNTAQMVDGVIREVLEALGPLDGPVNSDQGDVVRRLVETLLPGASAHSTEEDYPDRSEFGMYS